MDDKSEQPEESKDQSQTIHKKHFSSLLNLIASEVDISIDNIIDFELCLFDT